MRHRNVLLTALAVTAILAVVALDARAPKPATDGGQPLLPGLEAAVNDVSSVAVRSKQGEVTLERQSGNRWTVKEMQNYPADLGRLRELLIGLSKSRLLEAKTAKAENYARLGVDDAAAIRIVLGRGNEKLSALLVGNTSDKARQTFVRYPDDTQVWLASGTLRPFTTPKEYLRQEVLDIRPDRIRRLVIHHAVGEDVVLVKEGPKTGATVTPKPPEANQALMYQIQTTLRMAAHLALTEVAPQAKLTASEPDSVTLETFDGLTVVFRFNSNDNGEYVTIDATAADSAPAPVKSEASEIDGRAQGWAYRFAPYIMSQMKLSADTLTTFNGPVEVK